MTSLLAEKGISWVAYQEGMEEGTCPISSGTFSAYAPKHSPFIVFRDVSGSPPGSASSPCLANMKPYSELPKDLAAKSAPAYSAEGRADGADCLR